jgi:phosphoglycolate phosphatase
MLVQDYLKQVKYVLFDLDGTLIDTNQMKVESMALALSDLHNGDEFLHHFMRNFGLTREMHFSYLNRVYLNYDVMLTQKYRTRYEERLEKNRLNIEFCEGAKELIEYLTNRGVGMSVVTGSDQNEAREILETKELSQYFDDTIGSPNIKVTSVKRIIKKFGYKCKDYVLIGDSINDLEAAEACGISFIYASKYTLVDQNKTRSLVNKGGHWVVNSLLELLSSKRVSNK